MNRAALENWVIEYERLWRTAGTDELAELFAADAAYRASPWEQPVRGLGDIAAFWDAQRDGPDEKFSMTSDVVALDGDLGVVRVEVKYGNGDQWRDIWIIRFDEDGRCVDFEEWPIAPRS